MNNCLANTILFINKYCLIVVTFIISLIMPIGLCTYFLTDQKPISFTFILIGAIFWVGLTLLLCGLFLNYVILVWSNLVSWSNNQRDAPIPSQSNNQPNIICVQD